jgi:DNA-binding GntR family transcriptional regulator
VRTTIAIEQRFRECAAAPAPWASQEWNMSRQEQASRAPQTQPARGQVQDRVLATLRYGLMSGLFLPGQVVSLRKLAANLGTSPMPVRESLSRLVAAHALEERPNRSVRVPRLSPEGLAELFEVRTLIEGMATRIACEKITPELINELASVNEAVLEAHSRGAMAEVLRANQKFHFLIYRQANSDILMPLIESLWLRCGPTMYFSLNSERLWDTSSHMQILEAMRSADKILAERAMILDISNTGKYLIATAKKLHTTGSFADLSSIIPVELKQNTRP